MGITYKEKHFLEFQVHWDQAPRAKQSSGHLNLFLALEN